MIGGAAAREVIHPRRETPFVAVGVAVFEHPLKHRLRDILRRRALAGELYQKAEERAMVALEEFAKGVEFAVADGEHERVVGALFGGGVHGCEGARAFNHGRTRMNMDFFEGGNHGGRRAWLVAGKNRGGGGRLQRFPSPTARGAGMNRTMNRRDFLVRSSLFATAGLLARSRLWAQTPAVPPAAALAQPPAPPVTKFTPLRRNVGYFTGRGGTIGWLASKDALVVVDTQFPDTAAACLAGLPGGAHRQLDVVLNTHHHADHTGGNPIFKPVARTIVAHANVPSLQFAAAEKAGNLDKQVYADTTFTDLWRRQLGDEIVTAEYHAPAHTGGDAVMLFEQANVVHMGDLVFNRMYPVTDAPGGCSLRGWVKALEDVTKAFPADAIYVFGHGNPKFGVTGQRGDLLVMRDYLGAILDYTQRKIAAGEPKEKIVTLENFPGFEDFHSPLPNRLASNLTVAYAELTAKPA